MITKTLRVRVKDKHASTLCDFAGKVNFVWNYVNDLSRRSITERGVFLSGYQLQKYTAGSSKLLGIASGTIQAVCQQYATSRNTRQTSKLRWRKSHGRNRSLGWVPIRKNVCSWKNGAIYYNGHSIEVWDSYGLENHDFRSASFSEDARGRWYFNVVVLVEPRLSVGKSGVGIDLGCKDAATCSTGEKLQGRWFRELETKYGHAQRARKKREAKNIAAKITNRRKDALHKFSRNLVNQNAAIFVGNVSSTKLAKTRFAKSTYDAGWGILKRMLEYKCDHAGIFFEVIDEAYTTQTCSRCGCLSAGRPKGTAGLGIREWTCECGVTHDRDVNAAKNILALGYGRLAGGMAA